MRTIVLQWKNSLSTAAKRKAFTVSGGVCVCVCVVVVVGREGGFSHVPRLLLAEDWLQPGAHCEVDALRIDVPLAPLLTVRVQPPELLRASHHLQAAVPLVRSVDGQGSYDHVWERPARAPTSVPVAVVPETRRVSAGWLPR